jgi:hypothetical protein
MKEDALVISKSSRSVISNRKMYKYREAPPQGISLYVVQIIWKKNGKTLPRLKAPMEVKFGN